jgi:hypothetical protein
MSAKTADATESERQATKILDVVFMATYHSSGLF